MSIKWQDVPRDPIVDDDELDYLYQLAQQGKPVAAADPTRLAATAVPRLEQPTAKEAAVRVAC
jgi:hypothetical protein